MENASKALIIAGAILLSILIIGLGVYIFGVARGALGNVNLDPQKVSAYNSDFDQYQGTQSGTNARALYQSIQSHNRVNQDDTSLQIACEVKTSAVNLQSAQQNEATTSATPFEPADTAPTLADLGKIKAGNQYYVYFQYGKSGYITKCTIQLLKN